MRVDRKKIKDITTIRTVADLLKAVEQSMKNFNDISLWWRGQPDYSWNLKPKLYRQKKYISNESNLALNFRRQARVRHTNYPDKEDLAFWLFLMQHYGLPTRLLDWSESPLVALYFAVNIKKKDNEDAALWGLDATLLNKYQIDIKGICLADATEINVQVKKAFGEHPNPKKKKDMELSKKILALSPDQFDIRHFVQSSTFTIHGQKTPLNK